MADKYKAFTLFDWDDKTRPEVQNHGNAATVHVGGHYMFEISASSEADLKDQLEGYAEIFKAAADGV